ncbi:MAG: hypothetical protein NC911_04365 [Candidatus Omnitrophica bacterium]|nr:hypothetical protein [Candidatus Omnitrophota bacterium]
MSAGFHDSSIVHHQNFMGMHHRRKPVGNHKRSATSQQVLNGLLNKFFRLIVHRGCSLIQNQNRRVLQNCPGNGNPLFFSNRKPYSSFPNLLVITTGKGSDKLVGIGQSCCLNNFFHGSPRFAVGDVFQDSTVEKKWLLHNNTDVLA